MSKPRYMEELLKIIFSWLSATFIVMGVICFISILKSKVGSMTQELTILGIVFSLLGIAFFIVQIILIIITSLKNKLHNELLLSGTKIEGTVEKVYLQKYTQYGNKSPYRILYTYTWQGKVYHQKSYLLWDKPNFMERDSIAVYANDLGKSTIRL
ncbi:MAG: hypothetical protein HDR17_05975 [Lachnospiraceae bacterium]|nr:hypothetical protein [Lachnospiraceae bacterium]MBD5503724.1 hypothetical protein [Lachnospiraceae bacterium]